MVGGGVDVEEARKPDGETPWIDGRFETARKCKAGVSAALSAAPQPLGYVAAHPTSILHPPACHPDRDKVLSKHFSAAFMWGVQSQAGDLSSRRGGRGVVCRFRAD